MSPDIIDQIAVRFEADRFDGCDDLRAELMKLDETERRAQLKSVHVSYLPCMIARSLQGSERAEFVARMIEYDYDHDTTFYSCVGHVPKQPPTSVYTTSSVWLKSEEEAQMCSDILFLRKYDVKMHRVKDPNEYQVHFEVTKLSVNKNE